MANGSIIKVIEKNNVKYRCLDYIQSTGTQYINLGNFSWNADTDVLETKFKFDTISTTSNALWLYSLQGTSMSFDFYSQNSVFNLRPYQVAQQVYQMEQDTDVHTLKLDSANGKIYLDGVEKFSGIQKSSIGNVQFNLFRRNTGTGYASARIYNFFISRSGEKILDLIPVERISDNAIGLLDLISGTLYTNAGSGTFGKSYLKVEHIYKPKLKAKTYEKLEYIESSGTQYIQLPNHNCQSIDYVDTKFALTTLENNKTIYSMENTSIPAFDCYTESNKFMYRTTGDRRYEATYDTNIHTVHACYDGTYTIDGNSGTLSTASVENTRKQYLFTRANSPTTRQAKARIYYYSLSRGNQKLLDLIPVKRLKDNAIGMLDTLTNTFYANSGSGSFIGQSLSTPEYIEEDVEQVDYIQTDGSSVIDTDVIVKKNISKLEIDCNITTSANNHQIGCGGTNADVIFFTRGFVYLLTGSYDSATFTIPINQRKKYIADAVNNKIGYEGNLISLTPTANQSNDTFTIGARKNNGVYELGGSDIIYDFKAYENNVLVKHLIPVKYGTEYCMLDLVEMKLYHNAGSGAFSGGTRTEVKKLSQVYIANNTKYYALDYIESSGTQYIDLGVKGKNTTNIEFKSNASSIATQCLLGANSTNANSRLSIWNNGSGIYFNVPNEIKSGTAGRYNVDIIYEIKDGKCYVDGTQVGTYSTTYTTASNLWLFADNNSGSIRYPSTQKIYYFKLDDGTTKLDLIPVEKADGTKGMLDLVSGNFYGNSGSGSFSGNKREIILVS